MFADYTVFYDIWSLKVCKTTEMYLFTGSPNDPQPPISASPPSWKFSPPTLGTDDLEQGFPTWGTFTPGSTFAYPKGYI